MSFVTLILQKIVTKYNLYLQNQDQINNNCIRFITFVPSKAYQ